MCQLLPASLVPPMSVVADAPRCACTNVLEENFCKPGQGTSVVKFTDYLSCRSYSLLFRLVQLAVKQTTNNKITEQTYPAYFHFYLFFLKKCTLFSL